MAYTTTDLDAIVKRLEDALGSGYANVTFEGRSLVYRGTAEILKAIGYFNGLYSTASGTRRIKTLLPYTNQEF